MKKIDILNVEWPDSDRDLHIAIPVMVYLEKHYNLNVKTVSIFNAYYYIIIHRPKLIFISNFVGSGINHNITKLSYLSGIKVVSSVSEGNYLLNNDFAFWGHNSDKIFYLNKLLVWTKRYYEFYKNIILSSEYNKKVFFSGATGFDRYKILNFTNKETFLKKQKYKYKKIIGICGWGFDLFFKEEHSNYDNMNIYPIEQIKMYKRDLYKLQKIYKALIENNKDILFILRYHPGTIDFEKNEFYGLDIYDNVFISNKLTNNDYKISDLINISDLWIGYETTTALEAWLLGKQTFLINPTRSDFIRENIHKGSPIVKTIEESQKLIDEFYENSTIKSFELLEEERKKIIKDTIEYDDGKNHQRAAEEIVKVLNEKDIEIKFSIKIYIEAAKQILKFILSKTIFKNRWPNLKYKSDFAKKYQDIYSEAIDV